MMGIFRHWPNRITALRLVGAGALFVLLSLVADRDPAEVRGVIHFSFWLFVVTAATDFLDGWLARRHNLVSAFGRIADPFCDKVLIVGSMVFLSVLEWDPEGRSLFPAWIVVVIIAREFLVTGLRGYAESVGTEFGADLFGKIKMGVQSVAVGELLWMHSLDWAAISWLGVDWVAFWWSFGRVLVVATLITSVLSGLNYVIKSRHILAAAAE